MALRQINNLLCIDRKHFLFDCLKHTINQYTEITKNYYIYIKQKNEPTINTFEKQYKASKIQNYQHLVPAPQIMLDNARIKLENDSKYRNVDK